MTRNKTRTHIVEMMQSFFASNNVECEIEQYAHNDDEITLLFTINDYEFLCSYTCDDDDDERFDE